MKTILMGGVIMTAMMFNTADELTGRWQSQPSPKGNVTSVFFKPDNSFEGYVNKKAFTSGNYSLEDSVFSFTDNGCDGTRGVYKLKFFSNSDSLRFEVISDSCDARKEGMLRLVMGRIK